MRSDRAAHSPFGYGSRVVVWDQEAQSVSVSDGRVLEVITAGPRDGLPLIVHHGTPDAAAHFGHEWGFDLSDIRAPLSLWHGAQDRFVPIAHGEWLADHLTADAHLRPDHGHLSLVVTAYGEILDALLAQAG